MGSISEISRGMGQSAVGAWCPQTKVIMFSLLAVGGGGGIAVFSRSLAPFAAVCAGMYFFFALAHRSDFLVCYISRFKDSQVAGFDFWYS